MAVDQESFNKKLYDLLKTKGYRPVPKDSKNKRTENPQEADVFNFTFVKNGNEITDAWVTIDDAQDLIVYYDEEVFNSGERSEDSEFDDSWTGFVQQLKNWAMGKQLGFELREKHKLGDDMAQREYTKKKENINEGYYPMGKQSSYSDNIPTVKIVLQHTRQIQEGEQRYRNIARIYLENMQGERILAPTVRPGIAQVYARHLAEGGLPNDDRWNHIKSLCEEYNKMAGFVRATRNGQFNESAMALVTEGANHYQNLRETLSKMRGSRGYHKYFESYTPTLMETENDTSNLNELFVQEKLDPRIESVLPILSKLHKKLDEMKEVVELDEWAGNVVEFDQKPKMSKEKFQEISKKIQDIQMNPNTSKDPALKAQLAKAKAMLRKKAEEAGFEIAKEGWNDHLDDPNVGNEYWLDKGDAYRDQNKEPKPEEEVKENLGPEQKRVGQLGPTEKVKNNNIGKLVGESESAEPKTKPHKSPMGGEKLDKMAFGKQPMPSKTKSLKEGSDEARELELFATNDSDLYRQSYLPIVKNLERKFKKGIYDKELAKKLWVLHAARAAKKYGQEHGNDDGLKIFNTAVRREVADKLAADHFAEMEAGNFHDIVKEGKEPLFVAISLDKREEFEDWMDSEGFNVPEPKQVGNYFVYDYTNSDPLEQSYAEEWNEAVDAEDYEFGDEEFGDDEDDDLPFSGGEPAKGTIVDKSGAKHSPMSRVKDAAQRGMKGAKKKNMKLQEFENPFGQHPSGSPTAGKQYQSVLDKESGGRDRVTTASALLNDPLLQTYISLTAQNVNPRNVTNKLVAGIKPGKWKHINTSPAYGEPTFYGAGNDYVVKDPMNFKEFLLSLPNNQQILAVQDPTVAKGRVQENSVTAKDLISVDDNYYPMPARNEYKLDGVTAISTMVTNPDKEFIIAIKQIGAEYETEDDYPRGIYYHITVSNPKSFPAFLDLMSKKYPNQPLKVNKGVVEGLTEKNQLRELGSQTVANYVNRAVNEPQTPQRRAGLKRALNMAPNLDLIDKPVWFNQNDVKGLQRFLEMLYWKMNNGEASKQERRAAIELDHLIKVKSGNINHQQGVAEGQEELERILKLSGK